MQPQQQRGEESREVIAVVHACLQDAVGQRDMLRPAFVEIQAVPLAFPDAWGFGRRNPLSLWVEVRRVGLTRPMQEQFATKFQGGAGYWGGLVFNGFH